MAGLKYALGQFDWGTAGFSIDGKKLSDLQYVNDMIPIPDNFGEIRTVLVQLDTVFE